MLCVVCFPPPLSQDMFLFFCDNHDDEVVVEKSDGMERGRCE